MLWWLLVLLLMILFYFFRLYREERHVGSLLLWKRAWETAGGDHIGRKLRLSRLLILELFIALLLVLAMARPFLVSSGKVPAREMIIILDVSASMKAIAGNGGKSRFEKAVMAVQKLLKGAPSGSQAMLIAAGLRPVTLRGFSGDLKIISEILERVRSEDNRADLTAAVRLAQASLRTQPEAVIYVFTDAAKSELGMNNLPPSVQLVRISGREAPENLAVTTFNIRPDTGGGGKFFLKVENLSPPGTQAREATLEIKIGSRKIREERFSLSPGGAKPFIFDLPRVREEQILEASLKTEDALALDNTVRAVIPGHKNRDVLLTGEENPFLESALALLSEYNVVKDKAPQNAIQVINGGRLPALPPGGSLLLNVILPEGLMQEEDVVAGRFSPRWDETHPVSRFLNMAPFSVFQARKLKVSSSRTLASADNLSLICALEKGGSRAVTVNFALEDSDLPLSPAFPIFLKQALAWLSMEDRDTAGPGMIRTGQPIPLYFAGQGEKLQVMTPGGENCEFTAGPSPAYYTDTHQQGIYTFKGKHAAWKTAVNLLDRQESNLAVSDNSSGESVVSGDGIKAETGISGPPGGMIRELWWVFVLAALLLLFAETIYIIMRPAGGRKQA